MTERILAALWAGPCLKFENKKPLKVVFIYMEKSKAEAVRIWKSQRLYMLSTVRAKTLWVDGVVESNEEVNDDDDDEGVVWSTDKDKELLLFLCLLLALTPAVQPSGKEHCLTGVEVMRDSKW